MVPCCPWALLSHIDSFSCWPIMWYCQMVHVIRPLPSDHSFLEPWFGVLDSLIVLSSWSFVSWLWFFGILNLGSMGLALWCWFLLMAHCSWLLSLGSLVLAFDSWPLNFEYKEMVWYKLIVLDSWVLIHWFLVLTLGSWILSIGKW